MRKLTIFLVTLCASLQLTAQKPFKRNTGYVEIAGTGVVLSINYERQLTNKPGLAYHAGIGLGGDLPGVNAGLKYLFALGGEKSFFETGLGVVFAESYMFKDLHSQQDDKLTVGAGFIPSIGYRHHTPYGLMWRVNYTPVITSNRSLPVFFGVSAGWRF